MHMAYAAWFFACIYSFCVFNDMIYDRKKCEAIMSNILRNRGQFVIYIGTTE